MARAPTFVAGHSNAVTGAEEFTRALRATDRNLAREFGQAGRAIGQMITTDQKEQASAYSRQAAAASKAISILSMNTAGSKGGLVLRLSNARVPFALGAEFGARQFPQFPPWKGNQWKGVPEGIGYFFHPPIADNLDEAMDLYMQAVQTAGRKAGIDINNGPRGASAFDIGLGQAAQSGFAPSFMV